MMLAPGVGKQYKLPIFSYLVLISLKTLKLNRAILTVTVPGSILSLEVCNFLTRKFVAIGIELEKEVLLINTCNIYIHSMAQLCNFFLRKANNFLLTSEK